MPRYPKGDDASREAARLAKLASEQARRDRETAEREQIRREFEASEEARKLDERTKADRDRADAERNARRNKNQHSK